MHMFSITATDEFGSTYHQIREARSLAHAVGGFDAMISFDGTELIDVRAVNIDSVRVS